MRCWCHELSDDVFKLVTSAHAKGLETLEGILVIDIELLEGEARVLDQVSEQRRILHWLDDFLIVWEVLHGDA